MSLHQADYPAVTPETNKMLSKPPGSEQQQQPKKRNRITVVCNICKARKVKCDRKSPCTSCVKHSSMHLCTYNEEKPKRRRRKQDDDLYSMDADVHPGPHHGSPNMPVSAGGIPMNLQNYQPMASQKAYAPVTQLPPHLQHQQHQQLQHQQQQQQQLQHQQHQQQQPQYPPYPYQYPTYPVIPPHQQTIQGFPQTSYLSSANPPPGYPVQIMASNYPPPGYSITQPVHQVAGSPGVLPVSYSSVAHPDERISENQSSDSNKSSPGTYHSGRSSEVGYPLPKLSPASRAYQQSSVPVVRSPYGSYPGSTSPLAVGSNGTKTSDSTLTGAIYTAPVNDPNYNVPASYSASPIPNSNGTPTALPTTASMITATTPTQHYNTNFTPSSVRSLPPFQSLSRPEFQAASFLSKPSLARGVANSYVSMYGSPPVTSHSITPVAVTPNLTPNPHTPNPLTPNPLSSVSKYSKPSPIIHTDQQAGIKPSEEHRTTIKEPMKFTPSPEFNEDKSDKIKTETTSSTHVPIPNQEISPPNSEDGVKQSISTSATPSDLRVSEITKFIPVKPSRPSTPEKIRAIIQSFHKYEDVIGVNPISKHDETSDIFWNYPSIEILEDEASSIVSDINHGPFSVFAMMKKDVGLSDVWSFVKLKQKERKESAMAANKEEKRQLVHTPEEAKSSEDETEVDDMFIDISKEVLEILPTKKLIWQHIKRFFRFIYPFYPFLDETQFYLAMEALLGDSDSEDDSVPTSIHLKTREEYANVGILLLILNLSYQALISLDSASNEYYEGYNPQTDDVDSPLNVQNRSSAQIESMKYLLKHPINPKSINIVKNIIVRLQPLFNSNKTSLIMIQFLSYMRVYYTLAPTDYEDPAETVKHQTFDAQLFQSAYLIGLNKEPSSLKQILEDPKVSNLRRKIWRYLKHLDLQLIKNNGRQSSFISGVDTTMLPFSEDGNENVKFGKLESFTQASMTLLEPLYEIIRDTSELVLKSPKISLYELAKRLETVEVILSRDICPDLNKMLKLVNHFTAQDECDNVMRIVDYLGAKIFLFGNYYHLFMFYENANDLNLAFFYLKKLLAVMFSELMPNYELLLGLDHCFFGNSLNLLLNPVLITLLKKSNYYLFGILTRLTYTMQTLIRGDNDISVHKENMESDEEYRSYFGKITKFSLLITKAIKINLWYLLQFGEYYAYARAACSSQVHILNSVFCEDFYNAATFYLFCKTYTGEIQCHITHKEAYDLSRLERLCDFKLSTEQLDDLIEVLDTSIKGIKLEERFSKKRLLQQLKNIVAKDKVENPASFNKYFSKPAKEDSEGDLDSLLNYENTWACPFSLDPEVSTFFPIEFPSFQENVASLLEVVM